MSENDRYAPPNSYAPPAALRTAEETMAERIRELEQFHVDLLMEGAAARERAPRFTTAELDAYEAPNGYALKETK